MPQLKKISISRNNILPKLEFVGESIYSTYDIPHPDLTTYVPIFSDTKSSTGLSSEAEAESDGASSIPNKPRKRQRLDHLSQEEKIMRRKMKNRVAAQTARDRKKAKMAELEEQVIELETDRKMLMLANMNLQAQNEALQKENEELKKRLGGIDVVEVKEEKTVTQSKEIAEVESRLSDSSRSVEHAEGTGSATSYSLDDALRIFTNDSETDDIFDILQQYTDGLLQPEDLGSLSELPDLRAIAESETSTSEVVGTSPKSLESHKELIHFDHIYYKQEDNASNFDQSALSNSELSTKDCSMDISNSLDTGCNIEVDSSEIPVICISEPSNSDPSADVLQLENLYYSKLDSDMLSPTDIKPIPSPVSSDGGYDSSFSVSSPVSSAVNPWDDTFSELFPSLV